MDERMYAVARWLAAIVLQNETLPARIIIRNCHPESAKLLISFRFVYSFPA